MKNKTNYLNLLNEEPTIDFKLSKNEIDLIKLIRHQKSLGQVLYWVNVHCQDNEESYH